MAGGFLKKGAGHTDPCIPGRTDVIKGRVLSSVWATSFGMTGFGVRRGGGTTVIAGASRLKLTFAAAPMAINLRGLRLVAMRRGDW